MAREIKFRAWDKKQKKMLYGVSIGTVKVWDESAPLISYEFSYSADCIFEQYTGLKDKYGEEIYEGDVVALMYGYIPVKAYEKDQIKIDSAQKAVVRYADKKAAFRYTIIKQDKDCQFKFRTNESMVVIGNIHENPELLGGKE